jgi:hypothetical protein
MLTNEQKSLLKRAQRQAGLADAEYREALQLIAGVQSSTDPRIGDRHLDKLMGYFEAIYWRKVELEQCLNPAQLVANGENRLWLPFLAPDYWKNKNTKQETSRDRFVKGSLAADVTALENELYQMGFNTAYCSAIRLKVTNGRGGAQDILRYKAALERTVESKRKKAMAGAPDGIERPF